MHLCLASPEANAQDILKHKKTASLPSFFQDRFLNCLHTGDDADGIDRIHACPARQDIDRFTQAL